MADNTSMSSYEASGFGKSSGVSDIKGQLGNYATDDSSLRAQAEAQYAGTYDAQQKSYQTQIAGLIRSQADDSELLNQQYNKSMNSMMAQLQKRGLAVGGLPTAQNAALDKFRNEVMTQRQMIYGNQQSAIEANRQVHAAGYEANVQARMHDLKSYHLQMTNQLLTSIAELQNNSYQAYIDYLLAEKAKKKSSSGSRRSYSSGYSSAPKTTNKSSDLSPDYFKPSKPSNSGYTGTPSGSYTKQNSSIKHARYSAVAK